MVNILLNKIKELENEIKNIQIKNEEAKEIIATLCQECKIEKSKKENFQKKLLKSLNNLQTKKIEEFFTKEGALKYNSFLKIASSIHNGFLLIIDANFELEKQQFILGYLINKITPFVTLRKNMIIGMLDEKQFKEIKKLDKLPFYNPHTSEFDEIEIFKIIFDIEEFNLNTVEKAVKLFEEFRKRPSFKNKKYIEYSLIKNKVVDFEQEELNKQKEKYSYIYDEKYPNLEVILKREKNNIAFILALLERIDTEIDQIKDSKGILNIVNRMLNFIELNNPDSSIIEEVKFLREKLH